MNRSIPLAAALALAAALPAFALSNTITGVRPLDDRIDDIDRDARRDLNRGEDASRFNQNGAAQGFNDSAALTASGAWGNTDTGGLSFAGRLTFGQDDFSRARSWASEARAAKAAGF